MELFFNNLLSLTFNIILFTKTDELSLFERTNTKSKQLNDLELLKSKIYENYSKPQNDKDDIDEEDFQKKFDDEVLKYFIENKNNSKEDAKKIQNFIISLDPKSKTTSSKELNYLSIWKFISNSENSQKNDWKKMIELLNKHVKFFENISNEKKFIKSQSKYSLISDILYIISSNKSVYIKLIKYILEKLDENIFSDEISFKNNQENLKVTRDYLQVIQNYEIRASFSGKTGQSLSKYVSEVIFKLEEYLNKKNVELKKLKKDEFFKIFHNTFSRENIKIKPIFEFYRSINKLNSPSSKEVKMILFAFESFLSYKSKNKTPDMHSDFFGKQYGDKKQQFSVEHIKPQSSKRKKENKENDLKYIDLIGNQIIIPHQINSQLKDKIVEEKCNIYKEENYLKKLKSVTGISSEDMNKYIDWIVKMVEKEGKQEFLNEYLNEYEVKNTEKLREKLESDFSSLKLLDLDKGCCISNKNIKQKVESRTRAIYWILTLSVYDPDEEDTIKKNFHK
ncbi:GmrSD restriction endonuclease domain-containing protein [Mycoplasmopsis cricetuli]|uniref:GmrSD restriction endonuclease domain-containing protein n=1 Tax=Mycoplasmopsis cricetuli TaxID=171283 RepID=UPI0004711C1F|nr:DUF1524 domain-containing protein [Mycoplasmopsis cricetuli]